MRHFSCDLCGKDLTTTDARFVLRMELFAASIETAVAEVDEDSMEAMADLLDALEDESEPISERTTHTMEYDLCPGCRTRFAADPLGRDQLRKLRFSRN